MSSPTDSQNQAPNSPSQDPNHNQQEDPPQSNDPQSPKTLTLEIPDLEHPNLHADELKQDDPEDITPISPTISDTHFNSTSVVANFTASRRGGGGSKRSKRHHHQEKKIQKRLEILVGTFNPVPFVPVKTLDFASHEALLRRLGLWDFVHLLFDINIRTDLIIQLIANFNPTGRHSYVNGCRIKVSRADLARALSLPAKKDKVDSAVEVESEESIGFIEDFVSTWLLLHEDTWMMTDDILSVTKAIKEGHFEKVDWAKLIWLMLEKELAAAPKLGNCYYASHLQKLIKHQKSDLFKEEPVKMEVDVNDDSEEEDVRMSEEVRGGSELEEHNIELSLGGLDNSAKDDGGKEGKEQVGDEDTMDFEESKEDEEQRQWLKSSVEGHFLRQCNLGDVAGVECEERKQEEEAGEEEEKEGEDGGGGGGEEDDDEEEEEEEVNCVEVATSVGVSALVPLYQNSNIVTSSHLEGDDEEEVNCAEVAASAGMTAPMPVYQNGNIATSSHLSESTCVESTVLPPSELPSESNAAAVVGDSYFASAEPSQVGSENDGIFAMLANILEESPSIQSQNDMNEVHDINHGGNNAVNPNSNGIDIYDGLGDLGNLTRIDEGAYSTLDYTGPAMDQMLGSDDMQYLELMDLDAPLDRSTEPGGYEQVQTGGLHVDENQFFNAEDLHCVVNSCNSAELFHGTVGHPQR